MDANSGYIAPIESDILLHLSGFYNLTGVKDKAESGSKRHYVGSALLQKNYFQSIFREKYITAASIKNKPMLPTKSA